MLATQTHSYVRRPSDGTLYDVLDLILDKGLVIDAYVRVSLVGIELLTIDARVVVASVDTYLYFAERVDRLVIGQRQKRDITDLVGGMAKDKTRGALEGVKEGVAEGVRKGGNVLSRAKERLREATGHESARSKRED